MAANLKKRLRSGERLIGVMINRVDTLDIISMFSAGGLDYVLIDNEHGVWTTPRIADMTLLCNALDLGIIIRIPEAHRPYIQKYLDCGVDGLMLPNCHDADMARRFVDYAKYEPQGSRGISILRGHCQYGQVDDPQAFMARKNDETLLIAQIESRPGLKNVDEIMAVPGIDIALIGPNDLSSSLGIMGKLNDPVFIEATEKVVAAAEANGKWAAIQAMNAGAMREYMERGFRFMLYSNEVNMLLAATRQCVRDFREIDGSLPR